MTTEDIAPDPFDPAALRLDPSFTEGVAVKKLLVTVPCRKPGRQEFVRVHSDAAYRVGPIATIELKDEREVYIVTPAMAPELQGELTMVTLYTSITRQGVLFLWPVKLPAPDGRSNAWHSSAAVAAEHAVKRWVRISANMALGAYEVAQAEANIPDPDWPEHTFPELLKIAFRDRFIDRLDHQVILQLRGAL
jgi:hypothetical protein